MCAWGGGGHSYACAVVNFTVLFDMNPAVTLKGIEPEPPHVSILVRWPFSNL